MTARYMMIPAFAAVTGYSERAIRCKIEDGVWIKGREYKKAPDGHIFIDVEGFERWVEGQQAVSSRAARASVKSGLKL